MGKYKSRLGRWHMVKYNPDDSNSWVTYFKNRVFKKNNCINAIVTGLPGEGKSWSCLSQLLKFDPDFDIDTQLFFSASKMFRTFNDPGFFAKKGKAILFDEAGVDFSNVDWRNIFNRALKKFLQTGRHRNYVLMITVPFLTDISKGVRELMNVRWMAEGWKDNKTIISPRTMQYNDDKDRFYYKRLLVRYPDYDKFCGKLKLSKAPDRILIPYQKRKLEFTTNEISKDADAMELYEKKQKEAREDNKKPLTYLQEELIKDMKDGMTVEQIATKNGCVIGNIYSKIQDLRRKGIKITSKIINKKSEGFIVENAP